MHAPLRSLPGSVARRWLWPRLSPGVASVVDEDQRRTLRFALPVAAAGMLFEGSSHLLFGAGGPAVLVVFPLLAALLCGAGALAERRGTLPWTSGTWLLVCWLSLLLDAWLHRATGLTTNPGLLASALLILGGAMCLEAVPWRVGFLATCLVLGDVLVADLGIGGLMPTAFIVTMGVAMHRVRLRSVESIERERHFRELAAARETELASLRRLGSASAGFAHHFNNHLTAIGGNVDLARAKVTDPSVREDLDSASDAVGKAAALIGQLQRFARVADADAATERLPPATRLGTLLAPAALRRFLPAGVRLECRTAADLPDVSGDPDELAEALGALLRNAAEAGAGRVRVLAAPDGAGVRVTVEDDGEGLAPGLQGRLMEPFVTTREPTRPGLGLPAALATLRYYGGDLRLEPGESGARATLLLRPARVPSGCAASIRPGTPAVDRTRGTG